jgi:hypothetical protein
LPLGSVIVPQVRADAKRSAAEAERSRSRGVVMARGSLDAEAKRSDAEAKRSRAEATRPEALT